MIEETLKEGIEEAMDECFEDFDDVFEHETVKNYVPYGDTQVYEGETPTAQSEIRCEESFKQDFDAEGFIVQYLVNSKKFKEFLQEYVKDEYFK